MPAGPIEKFVLEQIRKAGQDPAVLEATLRQQRQQAQAEALAGVRAAQRDLSRQEGAMKKVSISGMPEERATLQDKIQSAERRLSSATGQLEKLKAEDVRPDDLRDALLAFEPVWEQLSPREQARLIRLLVARVDYDGAAGAGLTGAHYADHEPAESRDGDPGGDPVPAGG